MTTNNNDNNIDNNIYNVINEIQNKTFDLIYLGNKPCHYKPGWYKHDMQIKNET